VEGLAFVELPRRPSALLVGLAVHAVHCSTDCRPASITVIERDPIIVRVASEWFGLDRVASWRSSAPTPRRGRGLARAGRRFDYVMEDVTYADEPEAALPKLLARVPLVTPRGSLVINRHRAGPRPCPHLRLYFRDVRLRRVRRTARTR